MNNVSSLAISSSLLRSAFRLLAVIVFLGCALAAQDRRQHFFGGRAHVEGERSQVDGGALHGSQPVKPGGLFALASTARGKGARAAAQAQGGHRRVDEPVEVQFRPLSFSTVPDRAVMVPMFKVSPRS